MWSLVGSCLEFPSKTKLSFNFSVREDVGAVNLSGWIALKLSLINFTSITCQYASRKWEGWGRPHQSNHRRCWAGGESDQVGLLEGINDIWCYCNYHVLQLTRIILRRVLKFSNLWLSSPGGDDALEIIADCSMSKYLH